MLAVTTESIPRILSVPLRWLMDVIRMTPLIVQLIFVYYLVPVEWPLLWVGTAVIGVHYAMYMAESYIAGIASVVRAFQAFRAVNMLLGGVGAGAGLLGGLSLAPFLLLAGGIAAAAAVIKFNLFGIGDAIQRFMDAWNAIGSTTNNPVSRLLSSIVAMLDPTNTATGMLGDLADTLDSVSKRIEKGVERFQDVWDLLFGDKDTKQKVENAEKITDAEKELAETNEWLTDSVLEAHDPLGRLNKLMGQTEVQAQAVDNTVNGAA